MQPDSLSAGLQWQAMCCRSGIWFPSRQGFSSSAPRLESAVKPTPPVQWKPGRNTNLVTHLYLVLKLRMYIVGLLPQSPCHFEWPQSESHRLPSQVHVFLKKMYKKLDPVYQYSLCDIWGSHSGQYDDTRLVGCDAVWSGINLLTLLWR
jgi:hypothetical protein